MDIMKRLDGVAIDVLRVVVDAIRELTLGPLNQVNRLGFVNELAQSFVAERLLSHASKNWCPNASHRKPGSVWNLVTLSQIPLLGSRAKPKAEIVCGNVLCHILGIICQERDRRSSERAPGPITPWKTVCDRLVLSSCFSGLANDHALCFSDSNIFSTMDLPALQLGLPLFFPS